MLDGKKRPRSEQEIFDDLASLCLKSGFIHTVAILCFRDNVVGFGDQLKAEDYAKMFSWDRLIRTEISTLIGLMARGSIDRALPIPKDNQAMSDSAEALLKEMHQTLIAPLSAEIAKTAEDATHEPFHSAEVLREPIFYGAESAYSFQYRDFASLKYARDEDWIKANRGFTIEDASALCKAIGESQDRRLLQWMKGLADMPQAEWTVLPGFKISIADIKSSTGFSLDLIRQILDAFSSSNYSNSTFTSLSAYNSTNAFPIFKFGQDEYYIFQYVALTEALYESPFYWLATDKKYAATAMRHRGLFVEEFAADRLESVFGKNNVMRNVKIWKSKNEELSEIDVLVIFASRAFVVQAKSKKLTLESRRGNDLQLQKDFKGAIQDACDQAMLCCAEISSHQLRFTDSEGNDLHIPASLTMIHPICLISEHYPALSFQASNFLKYTSSTAQVAMPLVWDVFALDTAIEFLNSPLHFLNYVDLRVRAGNKIVISHENVALGYHLKKNLWLSDKYNMMLIGDDITADLDIAMAARREGIAASTTPDGILTFALGTALNRIIDEI